MKPVLITLRPLNARTSQREDIRVADGPTADTYGTAGLVWQAALTRRPTMSIELMSTDMDGKVQAGQARFEISLPLLQHADARRMYWKGASVVIHNTGVLEGPTAIPDFWGYITDADPDLATGRLSVTAQVSTAFIDKPLLTKEFTGGGGINGDPAKRGVLLPAGFGTCNNVPVNFFDLVRNIGMIDGYNNTLQINALFEGRSSFGPRVADYPTYEALAAAIDTRAIKAGQWGTCVALGLIGLGAPPTGVITVDAIFGSNRLGQIMKRILLTHAGVLAVRVQTSAFDALDAAVNRGAHYWTDQQRNVKDLLEALAQSANATPLVTFQNQVTVTRAVIGTPVATLDRSGSIDPRVIEWQAAAAPSPYLLIKGRAARPALVLTDDQVNYVDNLEDKGVYNSATVYRAGNLVWLADGSQWLYQNATPSAGHAPPSGVAPDINGDVYDAWWFRRQPPKTATDFTYADGTSIEALKPSEKGATVGMTSDEEVAFAKAQQRIIDISSDSVLSAGSEKQETIIRWNDITADLSALENRYITLGKPADITDARNNANASVSDLGSYLSSLTPPWNQEATDTPIDSSTWKARWSTAYSSLAGFRAAITGRKGEPGAAAPLVKTQWSINGVDGWHDNFFGADAYQRQSNDGGQTYGPAYRVVGEGGTPGPDGTSPSIVFLRSATVPATPGDNTGNPPAGWTDGPPPGTAYLWQSKATFRGAQQLTSWSPPQRISGDRGASAFTLQDLQYCYEPEPTAVIKRGGGSDWNAKAMIREGDRSVTVSGLLIPGTFIALTTDPGANASYDTLDYAIHWSDDTGLFLFRNNAAVRFANRPLSAGPVRVAIQKKNDTLIYTVEGYDAPAAHPANAAGEVVYAAFAIYRVGDSVSGITYSVDGDKGDKGDKGDSIKGDAGPPPFGFVQEGNPGPGQFDRQTWYQPTSKIYWYWLNGQWNRVGGDLFSENIISRSAQFADAVIISAKIRDLEVDTIKIRGNAVTNSVTKSGLGANGVSAGVTADTERAGMTSGGGTMVIMVQADGRRTTGSGVMVVELMASDPSGEFALSRQVAFSPLTGAIPVMFFAISSWAAGTSVQFWLRFSATNSTWNATSGQIAIMEYKR